MSCATKASIFSILRRCSSPNRYVVIKGFRPQNWDTIMKDGAAKGPRNFHHQLFFDVHSYRKVHKTLPFCFHRKAAAAVGIKPQASGLPNFDIVLHYCVT